MTEIKSSEPFPRINLVWSKFLILLIVLISSSLCCGGYLLKLFIFNSLSILGEYPKAFSFADNLINFFKLEDPKFGL